MSEHLTHLKELEAESIYILREVAAQFERPCILFSGGKDSIVLTYLAYKAFYPAKIPFPLVHIDTGHNFPETLTYRDDLVRKLGADLIVGSVQESIDEGKVKEETGLTLRSFRYLFSLPNRYLFSGFVVHTLDAFFEGEVDSFDEVKVADDAAEAIVLTPDAIRPEQFGLDSIRKALYKLGVRNEDL